MEKTMESIMRKNKILDVIVILLFVGCATLSQQKSFQDMTVKEKSVYIMSMYNKQYDEYLALYKKGDHSKEEKEILRNKYEALKELHPYIALYINYSEDREVPNDLIEQKLIALINRLIQ